MKGNSMTKRKNISPVSPDKTTIIKRRVNWHEAAACAIRIELRDYEEILEFQNEYVLGKNNYRIDMLIIKKLTSESIPKNIARIFQSYNLFEFKGLGSSISIASYYKTIGYAGIFISRTNETKHCTALDVTITFLSFYYPRNLIRHLIKERNIEVVKSSPGIYYVEKETFFIQIIVTKELPADENLYLRCMTNQLKDSRLTDRLADDYEKHMDQEIYTKYLNQITRANNTKKGESTMVCEGLFELYGTTSQEFYDRGKEEAKQEAEKLYLPKIDELASSNRQLSSQNDYLKELLRQNNISFNLEECQQC